MELSILNGETASPWTRATPLAVVLLAALAVPLCAQEWRGFPFRTFDVGDSPGSMITGDFNNDGITDLATANGLSHDVTVLLGNGSGGVGDSTFASHGAYVTGREPGSVTSGDFNGDGITDLVTSHFGSDNVSVLLGNGSGGVGDGTFATHVAYDAGDQPNSVTTGDFNGDGIIDLAIANRRSENISVLLGNGSGGVGDGTFAEQVTYAAGDAPRSVVTGDFNGDGITDLATANSNSDNVSVLLGNGDGTFATQVTYAAGDGPNNVTTGDFNGDGITDLATANSDSDNISVLLGNGFGGVGDGTFVTDVAYGAGDGPNSVTTGDFNGDGITDLATANLYSDDVSVLLGNESGGVGDGTFAAAVNYNAANGNFSVATGDFNDDGITDFAIAISSSGNVFVLLGNGSGGTGDGTFVSKVTYASGAYPFSITLADFNGDSVPDLATANSFSDDLSVLLGNGSGGVGEGTFAPPVNYPAGDYPYSVTTGDFNDDGITDLVTANFYSDEVSVLLGSGSGGVGDGTFVPQVTFAAGDGPVSVATGDFNSDGITDLVTANSSSSSVSVLLGNGSGGEGNGTFASHTTYAVGHSPWSATTGDFNSDGITDLVTANSTFDKVSVLLGNGFGGVGDGTFATHASYHAGNSPRSVTTGDFNSDGITDLATANYSSEDVSVLLGNGSGNTGDGTFSAPISYPVEREPVSVITGDFNRDGITDIATANRGSNNVSVLLGNGPRAVGDGTFAAQVTYATGDDPISIAAGDLNEDGLTDLVAANTLSDNVSVLLNLGLFEAEPEPDPVLTPNALVFGNVEAGSGSSSLPVVIEVTGDADLISTPTLTNDGGGVFSITAIPASPLAQGANDTLEVSFAPDRLGRFVGEVSLATNDLSSPVILIHLSGSSLDPRASTGWLAN
ncbi:MAG: FG-GAP-like repeat-containing protein [Sumerlaeia bacterium]